ncbi:Ig-like domain-containing protein [Paraglaciecola psychrophila]|uniref:Ig-like domain-containing protein n=1 Tax=Paraglaciecola psychrophila TaxID=326544 RepID=UPI0005570AFD|nr:tandem-95 repeat protein [Paraglaciecola psychrophila]
MTLGDVDGDGDLDLVTGNSMQTNKLYSSQSYNTNAGNVYSQKVNGVTTGVVGVTLTVTDNVNTTSTPNTSIDYFITNNGGAQWHSVSPTVPFYFPDTDTNDVRWRATLRSLSPSISPKINDVSLTYIRQLTVSGLTAVNKAYDGNTVALASGTVTLSGVASGSVNTVALTGTPSYAFAGANVGTGIVVTTTGYTLTGADASNYTLIQPVLSADITEATDTLNAGADDTRVFVAGDTFTQAATGGSGTGTVTYSSSTLAVATVDGSGGVSIVGAGSAVITASRAADTDYQAISDTYTLIITNQPYITITAVDMSSNALVSPSSTSEQSISLTFTSTDSTADFINDDITVTNGTLSGFSGAGSVYSATFTSAADGVSTISVLANTYTASSSSNANITSNVFTLASNYASTTAIITVSTATTSGDTSTVTESVLNAIIGLTGVDTTNNLEAYKTAIALVANAGELDTLIEIQALIDAVNTEQAAIAAANGASDAGLVAAVDDINGNTDRVFATAAQLNAINGVTGAVSGVDYLAALLAGTYVDRAKPTAAEIQTVITAVNAAANNTAPVAQEINVDVAEDIEIAVLLMATDAQGDTLNYVIVTEPSNGTLTLPSSGEGLWFYQGNADYHGNDSFSYQASDGVKTSNIAQVNIVVRPVNDSPVAEEDALTLIFNDEGSYVIDALANDSDIDGDSLTITRASTTIGNLSIDEGQLVYQLSGALQETIELTYTIDDGTGSNNSVARGLIRLTIDSTANEPLPIVISVNDVQYQAHELFTKIVLDPPVARDNNNNIVAVSLVDDVSRFAPGNHLVYWQAENNAGIETLARQQVAVYPLISLSQDKQAVEGGQYSVSVYLNGPAPVYPVIIGYTVGGSADAFDHDLTSGVLIIEQGIEGAIAFSVFSDGLDEDEETLTITLDESQNIGAKSVFTLTIAEQNLAPDVTYSVTQANEQRLTLIANEDEVVIQIQVTDANSQDTHSYQWSSDNGTLINSSSDQTRFTFTPTGLEARVTKLTLTVSDDGSPVQSTQTDIYLNVVAQSIPLTDQDSDGDLLPDNQEGYNDSDLDGIPDYLDMASACNVMPVEVTEQQKFLVESEPGVCLRKGLFTQRIISAGLLLLEADDLPGDLEARNTGGIYDFIVNGLPIPGQSAGVVLPQYIPIGNNALYRKYSTANTWVNFTLDDKNSVASSEGELGYCPPTNHESWTPGLTLGHWCVQLLIEDGGPNDDDGLANGTIVDPSGVGVVISENSPPIAQPELVELLWNTDVTLDVLANDSDAQGDTLTIISAAVDFGEVLIINEQLHYTPAADFAGVATIIYAISDNYGGTGFAKVTVTVVSVVSNTIPIATNDTAMTDDYSSITIDVLANDSDEEGDTLTIHRASTQKGTVTITTENTLLYTPLVGFDGIDIIDYTIDDGNDNQASAQVSVTVRAYKIVTVTNTTKGGSMGLMLIGLAGLLLLRLLRLRRASQQATGQLTTAMALMLCITLTACTSPDDYVVVEAQDASLDTGSAEVPALVDTNTLVALPQDDEVSTSAGLPVPQSTLVTTTLPLNTEKTPTLTAPSVSDGDHVLRMLADELGPETVTEPQAEAASGPVTDTVIDITEPATPEPIVVVAGPIPTASPEGGLIADTDEPAGDITGIRATGEVLVTEVTVTVNAPGVMSTGDTPDATDNSDRSVTTDTPLIANSASDVGDEIHWFITVNAGHSKVIDTLLIPSNNKIEDISIDNQGSSYTIGGGFHYQRFSFIISYTNLGEAGAEISGTTLNRDSFEQSLLNTAPKLVDGVSVETQYTLWSNDRVTAAVGVGLLAWSLDDSSQLQSGTIRGEEQGVDVFYQANLAYELNERMHVTLKVARYQLALNKVNNVTVGLQYHF